MARPLRVVAYAATGLLLLAGSTGAQSYEVLVQFSADEGGRPSGSLIQASDGSLYGTTTSGGTSGLGSVFKLTPSGEGFDFARLHSFTATEGGGPRAALIEASDGFFYGTTVGAVFRMDRTGEVTVLHPADGPTGGNFAAPLIQASDGLFYGTASVGGAFGYGTVFRMDATGATTALHSFDRFTTGSSPYASLIEGRDGLFYGTTPYGGASDFGTVFRMDRTGAVTVLHSFDGPSGAFPQAPLIEGRDGSFYGTSQAGGTVGYGTVFRMDSGGRVTVLLSFDGRTTGGDSSASLIQARDGAFYGTTYTGGAFGNGTVFRMDGTGAVTVLHAFDGPTGAFPRAPLIEGIDGLFYGTTDQGGGMGAGTVFRLDRTGGVTVLHSFGDVVGHNPIAPVLQARDGSFYGTTEFGGASGVGTVFRTDTAGSLTVLHTFDRSTGARPFASLIQAEDGYFYGTTLQGGASDAGTVFRMDASGNVTVLHAFDYWTTGGFPDAPLIQATDGSLYGVTAGGGAFGGGTVFRVDRLGATAVMHAFDYSTTGGGPAGLIQASDGFFYGTTFGGGAAADGTVFRMDSLGTVTVLHSFDGTTTGANPNAGVIQASDGSFYGTTSRGEHGTVFRMDSLGAVTVMHAFDYSTTGANPESPLMQASDGFIYGTTQSGGASGLGTLFRMDRMGAVTVLHAFDGSDGASPYAPLIEASDGNLYGTASGGGPEGGGVVFRLTPLAVRLVTPNGGETLFSDLATTIRWTAAGAPIGFDVELSRDDGATFAPLPGCTRLAASTTSCEWIPTGAHTRSARVRVTAYGAGGASVADESDASFSIRPATPRIVVTAPHPGARWTVGSTRTIRWHHNLGLDARVRIELSRDRGATWEVLDDAVTTTAAHKGTFRWVVTGPPTAHAVVRVSWVDGLASGTNPEAFSIGPRPELTLVRPSSAVTWRVGSRHSIQFSHTLGPDQPVVIDLSRDEGRSWRRITQVTTTGAHTGAYHWTVTGPPTALGRIRIRWADDQTVADVSDTDFVILARRPQQPR